MSPRSALLDAIDARIAAREDKGLGKTPLRSSVDRLAMKATERTEATKKKKWVAWFKPLQKAKREGPLLVAPVEILQGGDPSTRVIVSVPRLCGNAVQRNRFRRIVKAYFDSTHASAKETAKRESSKAPANRAIWIRLLNKYRFDRKITLGEWKDLLDAVARDISA